MGQRKRIPWDEIRLTYLEDPTTSLRALARQHSIDYRNLQRRSKKENWKKQRSEFRAAVTKQAMREAGQALSKVVPRNLARALEQLHELRCSFVKSFHEGLGAGATPQTIEETQVATRTTGSAALRRITKKRTVPVDAKALAALLASEVALLKLTVLLRNDDQNLVREIVIR